MICDRLARLRDLGLDNVQIPIQDVSAGPSDRIAGRRSIDRKLQVARWIKELGLPLTLNTVLHRENLDAATDPACSLAPTHTLIEAARREAVDAAPVAFEYRTRRPGARV